MNYTEFENKVKSMNAHEIIMAMVEGLRNPRTKIDMTRFGLIINGVCYGCAATNAILHIMNVDDKEEVKDHIRTANDWKDCPLVVSQFELAISRLRRGWIVSYNGYAREFGFAPITPMPGQDLPRLENDYTEEQLEEYVKLAKHQLTRIKPTNMKNLPIVFSQTDSGRTVGVLSLPHGVTLKIKAFVEPGRVAYHLSLYEGNRKRFQKLMDPGPGFWPEKDLFWGDNSHNRGKQAIAYLWERTFGYMDIPGIKEFFIIEND